MTGYVDQYDQTPVVPDPVKPVQPDDAKNQTDNKSKAQESIIHPNTSWIKDNMTLVIIAGSAIVLLFIIVVYFCCCRKGTAEKKTDYMNKAYSVNEESTPLDNEKIQ
jgi:flagellar biosynthesis/type III secretory pathway M-ring protein FliF/YscJ